MSEYSLDLGIEALATKVLISEPQSQERDEQLATKMAAWGQLSAGIQGLGISDELGELAEDMANRCQRALYPEKS